MNGEIDNQEYFDKTIAYLRGQGAQCVNLQGFCLYRNGENRCAVGYHFSEGLCNQIASLNFNQKSLGKLIETNKFPDIFQYLPVTISLATELQELHDLREYRKETGGGLNKKGEGMAKLIAKRFGLKYTPPAAD